jgi:hypothetical protein
MKTLGAMAVLLLTLSAGCRTPPAPVQPPPPPSWFMLGRIMHVNDGSRYVVVRCGGLPSPGEEATVFRGGQPVGRLRFSGPSRPPFATADVVEGRPQEGDAVKVLRQRSASAQSEVVKP